MIFDNNNYYGVTISPMLTSDDAVVFTPSWSTTVKRNVEYTASIFATNCVGNSSASVINFIISKYRLLQVEK